MVSAGKIQITMDDNYEEHPEVHKKIKDILNACAGNEYIYRGEKRKHKNISSGLYRHYCETKEEDLSVNPNDFSVTWEEDTLERVEKHFQDNFSPIEMLTELQHYGGKTTLIDFTFSLYTALFFACNGRFKEDGRIILLNRAKLKGLEKPGKGIDYANNTNYILIQPTSKNTRVTFQNSTFVHAPKGYIDQENLGENIKDIKIEKRLKSDMLEYLKVRHGIHDETIYNDLQGFIKNDENYFMQESDLYIGMQSIQAKKYEKAKRHLTKFIDSGYNTKTPNAHYHRAAAKEMLGYNCSAVEDLDIAITEDQNFASAYELRGKCYQKLRNYNEALANYKHAERLHKEQNNKDELQNVRKDIRGIKKKIQILSD